MPEDPDDTSPVWRLGDRYRVTGRIGSGGMAEVFRAHDEMLQRDVAVKVFRTGVSDTDTAAGADRQRAELLALASLNHPHLITLYDGSVAAGGGPTYLVMELIDGPTLAARIDDGPLPEPEVRRIGAQVADALAYVHTNDMVHRDVKPANILLGSDAGTVRARLSDFGIVRLLGAERLTNVESTLGTASYLAPEQARGSAVGPAADIYALGLTLIEALTGTRSFDGATPLEAVIARLDHDPAIPQRLPAPWPGLLAAMTARDPARRPNAGQVAQALRSGADSTTQFIAPVPGADAGTAVLSRLGPPPPVRPLPVSGPPRPPAPPPRRSFPAGWIVAAGVAIAIIAIGLIILFATSGGDPSAPATSTPAKPTTSTASTASTTSSAPRRTQSNESTSQQSETASKPKPKKTKKTKASKTKSAPTTKSAPSTQQSNPPSVSQSAPSDTTSP